MLNIGEVTHAYMVAALWSSTDTPSEGADPVELDSVATLDDYTPEAVAAMQIDCERFVHSVFEQDLYTLMIRSWDSGQIGHDLWLTRNGHGTGFWDRGHGVIGDRLTTIAGAMGEAYVELGDDSKVHYRG